MICNRRAFACSGVKLIGCPRVRGRASADCLSTPLFSGNNNSMPRAIYNTPEMRQMYLRRLRTLMDELLKPPGTPADELHYEPRIDELAALIAPDAALDAAKWNSHAWGNGSTWWPWYPKHGLKPAETSARARASATVSLIP